MDPIYRGFLKLGALRLQIEQQKRRFCPKTPEPRFGGVRVLGTCWKAHKRKGYEFLHRSCTQEIFSTPTKNIFSSSANIFPKLFWNFWVLLVVRVPLWLVWWAIRPIIREPSLKPKKFQNDLVNIFAELEKIVFVGVEKISWVQLRCKNS